MTNITTKTVADAIIQSMSKGNTLDAIREATDGQEVSEKIIESICQKIGVVLAERKAEKPEAFIGNIRAMLKAAPALPNIHTKALALFDKTTRKGSVYSATRAGINAYGRGLGDNEIAEYMAEKCPLMTDAEVALLRVKSLFKQLSEACAKAGGDTAKLQADLNMLAAKLPA